MVSIREMQIEDVEEDAGALRETMLTPAISLYLKCGFVPEAYLSKEWWRVDFIKMSLWLEG